jgi:hypothetical protein
MIDRPLFVDWKSLKRMGWPYSRVHTWRMMKPMVPEPGKKRKGEVTRLIPNPDPFPLSHKLSNHWNAHPVWRVTEVLAYFEAHGLQVTDDWYAPA